MCTAVKLSVNTAGWQRWWVISQAKGLTGVWIGGTVGDGLVGADSQIKYDARDRCRPGQGLNLSPVISIFLLVFDNHCIVYC